MMNFETEHLLSSIGMMIALAGFVYHTGFQIRAFLRSQEDNQTRMLVGGGFRYTPWLGMLLFSCGFILMWIGSGFELFHPAVMALIFAAALLSLWVGYKRRFTIFGEFELAEKEYFDRFHGRTEMTWRKKTPDDSSE